MRWEALPAAHENHESHFMILPIHLTVLQAEHAMRIETTHGEGVAT
jgi:hypothetical protein